MFATFRWPGNSGSIQEGIIWQLGESQTTDRTPLGPVNITHTLYVAINNQSSISVYIPDHGIVDTNVPLIRNKWYHIGLTYRQWRSTYKVWLDGEMIAKISVTNSTAVLSDNGNVLRVGVRTTVFKGLLSRTTFLDYYAMNMTVYCLQVYESVLPARDVEYSARLCDSGECQFVP